MDQAMKKPAHLWIVGLLALIWNGIGCYDYVMTRLRNEDYFRSMGTDPQAMLAWVDGFPLYGKEENGEQITNDDLDEYHGHFGVTEDYPSGIYHYHVTDEEPYIIGTAYYGKKGIHVKTSN